MFFCCKVAVSIFAFLYCASVSVTIFSLDVVTAFSVDFVSRYFNESAIADNVKLMLFRIIQEQVNNIIRHSHATEVHIKLQSDAESIILTIEDNGTGFDPEKARKGMGLNNIASRAALMGGKADIKAAPGEGCILTVELPQSADMEGK